MNKEEYAIDEKTYENYDGLKIKIIFSNLGRRYKKIGDNISLMLEKETVKLKIDCQDMCKIVKICHKVGMGFLNHILYITNLL